ncbi:MAG: alpha-galactosidase [Planctomycetota bacterium]
MIPSGLLLVAAQAAGVTGLAELPPMPAERIDPAPIEWLVEAAPHAAAVLRGPGENDISLDNGLLRRTFRITPDGACATVALDDLTTGAALLRAVRPEARLALDGTPVDVGGLTGQPNHAFLDPAWLAAMEPAEGSLRLTGLSVGPIQPRLEWKRVRHHAPGAAWPPKGVELALRFLPGPESAQEGLTVTVHYALYDGIPAYSKWLTLTNESSERVTLERFSSEILAAVEHSSWVETRGDVRTPPPDLHVETDYAFAGMTHWNANGHVVRWAADPEYATQVNYLRTAPCLLDVGPELGPAQWIEPGATFETFRTFVMPASGDRERRGLAQRKLYRTVAPWVTENPLMMHVRWSDRETVERAIDQCAAVGFEMVILTFGSGFDAENDSPDYLAELASFADYARARGVEIGGYSLLASRRIEPASDNCIHPETGEPGADIFGSSPSLTSAWGQAYFAKLRSLYDATGFMLLEHDGSWPGSPDAAARPPLQRGLEDSRWAQWRVIDEFYAWCRGRGIYLNVPDYYYLAGSNKCGMGYRETNWSLPREQQVIHTRQNIYDGTWRKTPSMGWMFVPLTEYHGGGAAATIEPLSEHLDHYRRMLRSNLALGVQACYRGPRLFDAPETEAVVREEVAWFKEHRTILEADVIHGRRADGRGLDWMLHADPHGATRGMLVVFNPTPETIERTLHVDLHYAGVRNVARIRAAAGAPIERPLDGTTLALDVTVPARSMEWFAIQ